MGTHCSSELRRGHRNITMKLLLLTVFAAVALAEEVAEVEEVAKSAVVPLGYGYHPYAYNQLHWPAYYGNGFSSQCWGCRGKRSADPAPGVSPYFPGNIKMEDINYGKTQIKYLSKRSAEAEPYYGFLPYGYGLPRLPFYHGLPALPTLPALPVLPALKLPVLSAGINDDKTVGVAAHPETDATAWTQRSAQGLGRRKREAEADPGLLGYGYYPYAYHPYAYHAVHVVPVVPAITGDGVAAHPNAGTSFVGPTTWGFQ